MPCISCKRKLVDVVKTVQKLADFDNATYFVYQTASGDYNFTIEEKENYLKKIEPMQKEKPKYIKFKQDMYRLDKFTYVFYRALTKTPSKLEYEMLTGIKNGDDIQKSSKEIKRKARKQIKSKSNEPDKQSGVDIKTNTD